MFNVASVHALGFAWNSANVTEWGFGYTSNITLVSETFTSNPSSASYASAYGGKADVYASDSDLLLLGLGNTGAFAIVFPEAYSSASTNPNINKIFWHDDSWLVAQAQARPDVMYSASASSEASHEGVLEFHGEGQIWLHAYYNLDNTMVTDIPGDMAGGGSVVEIQYQGSNGEGRIARSGSFSNGEQFTPDPTSGLLSVEIFNGLTDVNVDIPFRIEVVAQSRAYSAPEPSTVVLFSCGLLGLAAFRRKFRKE